MRVSIIIALAVLATITGCLQTPRSVTGNCTVQVIESVTQEYLNGTWGRIPKENYTGAPLSKQKYSWGEGEFSGISFLAFDIEEGIYLDSGGLRFICCIKELEPNVFEVGLDKPIDHKPTDEEIAAHKAAGPDELIVVHFINRDQIWIDIKKGMTLGEDFDPKQNRFYRYSGPGSALKNNK